MPRQTHTHPPSTSVPVAPTAVLDASTRAKLSQVADSIKALLRLPDPVNQLKGLKGIYDVAQRDPPLVFREFLAESGLAPFVAPTLKSDNLDGKSRSFPLPQNNFGSP